MARSIILVMSLWNHYLFPISIDEALSALRNAPGPACLVAGGTDLLLELQQGHHPPVDTLVDIGRIPELACLEVRGEALFIGAAVPVAQLAEAPVVRCHAEALAEACGLIGGPQVRNTATLGGNVAHALPAADGMIALVALDAQAEIASSASEGISLRRVPLLSLFRGPGKSALVPDREILVGFYLPKRQLGQASTFLRIMRPQGVALPILNLAVWLARAGDRIIDVRLVAGPAGPVPRRAAAVEDALRDAVYNSQALGQACQIWQETVTFRSSPRRASAEYRRYLSGLLLEEGLERAWQRAALFSGEG